MAHVIKVRDMEITQIEFLPTHLDAVTLAKKDGLWGLYHLYGNIWIRKPEYKKIEIISQEICACIKKDDTMDIVHYVNNEDLYKGVKGWRKDGDLIVFINTEDEEIVYSEQTAEQKNFKVQGFTLVSSKTKNKFTIESHPELGEVSIKSLDMSSYPYIYNNEEVYAVLANGAIYYIDKPEVRVTRFYTHNGEIIKALYPDLDQCTYIHNDYLYHKGKRLTPAKNRSGYVLIGNLIMYQTNDDYWRLCSTEGEVSRMVYKEAPDAVKDEETEVIFIIGDDLTTGVCFLTDTQTLKNKQVRKDTIAKITEGDITVYKEVGRKFPKWFVVFNNKIIVKSSNELTLEKANRSGYDTILVRKKERDESNIVKMIISEYMPKKLSI